jgi:hypothetical protein
MSRRPERAKGPEPARFTHGVCSQCGTPRSRMNPAWLRWKRQRAELTLRAFADKAGVSAPYICDIELGRRTCLPEMRARYEALR